ncbi:MAG: hypothetical protein L0Z62_22955, partial [Gemmataceae bacterium]|nr:hypothetical protein [Gemmataceae bacterium]
IEEGGGFTNAFTSLGVAGILGGTNYFLADTVTGIRRGDIFAGLSRYIHRPDIGQGVWERVGPLPRGGVAHARYPMTGVSADGKQVVLQGGRLMLLVNPYSQAGPDASSYTSLVTSFNQPVTVARNEQSGQLSLGSAASSVNVDGSRFWHVIQQGNQVFGSLLPMTSVAQGQDLGGGIYNLAVRLDSNRWVPVFGDLMLGLERPSLGEGVSAGGRGVGLMMNVSDQLTVGTHVQLRSFDGGVAWSTPTTTAPAGAPPYAYELPVGITKEGRPFVGLPFGEGARLTSALINDPLRINATTTFLNLSANRVKGDQIGLQDHIGFLQDPALGEMPIARGTGMTNEPVSASFIERVMERAGTASALVSGTLWHFVSPESNEVRINAPVWDAARGAPGAVVEGRLPGSAVTNLTAVFGQGTATLNQVYLKDSQLMLGGGAGGYIDVAQWGSMDGGPTTGLQPRSDFYAHTYDIPGGLRIDLAQTHAPIPDIMTDDGVRRHQPHAEFQVNVDQATGAVQGLRSTWQDAGSHLWIPGGQQLTVANAQFTGVEPSLGQGLVHYQIFKGAEGPFIGLVGGIHTGTEFLKTLPVALDTVQVVTTAEQIKALSQSLQAGLAGSPGVPWQQIVNGLEPLTRSGIALNLAAHPELQAALQGGQYAEAAAYIYQAVNPGRDFSPITAALRIEGAGIQGGQVYRWASSENHPVYGDHMVIPLGSFLSKDSTATASVMREGQKAITASGLLVVPWPDGTLRIVNQAMPWFSMRWLPGDGTGISITPSGTAFVSPTGDIAFNLYTSPEGIPIRMTDRSHDGMIRINPFIGEAVDLQPDVFSFQTYRFEQPAPFQVGSGPLARLGGTLTYQQDQVGAWSPDVQGLASYEMVFNEPLVFGFNAPGGGSPIWTIGIQLAGSRWVSRSGQFVPVGTAFDQHFALSGRAVFERGGRFFGASLSGGTWNASLDT